MKLHWFLLFSLSLFLLACGEAPPAAEAPAQPAATAAAEAEPQPKKAILFFGNSLTAAYGLDPADGYVSLLQQRLDSLGYGSRYQAVNAGLSGETTAGGRERIDWVLRRPVDIFVLELGGNDALRGVDPATSKENLDAILTTVREKYPEAKIILAGMQAPPNLGERYTTAFRDMYPELAKKHDAALIPFFLENVGGIPELNLPDRIHPNKAGQKILLENVWEVLQPQLEPAG